MRRRINYETHERTGEMRKRRQAENEGRNEDRRVARWRNQGDGDGWLK